MDDGLICLSSSSFHPSVIGFLPCLLLQAVLIQSVFCVKLALVGCGWVKCHGWWTWEGTSSIVWLFRVYTATAAVWIGITAMEEYYYWLDLDSDSSRKLKFRRLILYRRKEKLCHLNRKQKRCRVPPWEDSNRIICSLRISGCTVPPVSQISTTQLLLTCYCLRGKHLTIRGSRQLRPIWSTISGLPLIVFPCWVVSLLFKSTRDGNCQDATKITLARRLQPHCFLFFLLGAYPCVATGANIFSIIRHHSLPCKLQRELTSPTITIVMIFAI